MDQHSKRRPERIVTTYSLLAEADTVETDTLPTTAWREGPAGMEGQLTGDGRGIQPGALRWECSPR